MTEQELNIAFEKYHRGLLFFSRRLAGEFIAEDLTQSAFIKLWEAKGRHTNIKTFLYTCVVNEYKNIVKSDSRHEKVHKELLRDLQHQQNTVHNAYIYSELLQIFYEQVETLTPKQKQIIQLIKQGYSTKQISQLLNISMDTVRVQKARSIKEIKNKQL